MAPPSPEALKTARDAIIRVYARTKNFERVFSTYGSVYDAHKETILSAIEAALAAQAEPAVVVDDVGRKYALGDRVRKIRGSSWQGAVVGFYSTALTERGYAVESEREPGSVQIYPEAALEPVPAPKPRG